QRRMDAPGTVYIRELTDGVGHQGTHENLADNQLELDLADTREVASRNKNFGGAIGAGLCADCSPHTQNAASGMGAGWFNGLAAPNSASRSLIESSPAVESRPAVATRPVVESSVAKAENYTRPSSFRAGVRDKAWEGAVEASTGRVRDPKTGRFMSKEKPWDMGHKPGYEFRKHKASAAERSIDRNQFLNEHNDPSHYRPELPESNRSHVGENVTDDYFGP
ncbi:MAG TPA: HNH/ENDO VII family nuclease, partial [Polyangiaceae bacterium]|nr:HNH/ENDO VII family nuclease [Polyangiaceae bacterium]